MARLSAPAAARPFARRLGACGLFLALVAASAGHAAQEPAHPASLDEAIVRAAARHGVPESLVRRIVMRESKYNPRARNRAYWGLMQISYPTARSMGFHGSPEELLNPVVNLRYAVPYLANAFIIAGRRQEEAVRLYAAGYYYSARTRGLIGALRTADSAPLSGVADEPDMVASAAPAPEPGYGIFGGLFGPNEMPRDTATEQAVYAAAPPQPAAALPGGKAGTDVAMVADKRGDLHPPKSWQRDGGSTVIARGEQGIEQVAAYKGGDTDAGSRRHARKSTVFAALDAPATAQAYAAAPGQEPRLAQADSQAAISHATAVQPQAVAQPTAPAVDAAAAKVEQVADEHTSKKTRQRRARRSRHRESEPETAVAAAAPQPAGQPPVLSSDQQAAMSPEAQPASAPVQAADAAPQPSAGAQAQDAGAAAQAQFDQTSGSADADGGPSRRHKRHARRGHGRKADTEVAAQAPGDGQPQAAPPQVAQPQ